MNATAPCAKLKMPDVDVGEHEPRRHDRVDRAGDESREREAQELLHARGLERRRRLAEVGVAHGLVALDLVGQPFREDAPEVEDHDAVAVLHDEAGVVLDEEHRATGLVADGIDQVAEPFRFRLVETRRGLVEEQELRLVDDRTCELDHARDADRQRAGELLADGGEAAPFDHVVDAPSPVAFADAGAWGTSRGRRGSHRRRRATRARRARCPRPTANRRSGPVGTCAGGRGGRAAPPTST